MTDAKDIIARSMPPTAALLDEERVSSLLCLSKRTLQDHRLNGVGLPWVKISGVVRYPRAAVEDWLTERTVMPKSNTVRE